MITIHAIYEDGVFKPIAPVALPESCEVEFEPRVVESIENLNGSAPNASLDSTNTVSEILSQSVETGQADLAARHNEHQP